MHGTTRTTRQAVTAAIASTALIAALGRGRQVKLCGVVVSAGLTTNPAFRVRLTNGDGGVNLWQGDVSANAPHIQDTNLGGRRTTPNVGLFIVIDQVTGTPAGEVIVEWEPW